MDDYEVVNGPLRVPAGHTVKLTSEQIDARTGMLDVGKGGVCFVLQPIEFKTGETLGVIGDMPGHIAERLDKPGRRKAKAGKASPKKPAKAGTKPAAEKPSEPGSGAGNGGNVDPLSA